MKSAPQFPPLLNDHCVPQGKEPIARAHTMLAKDQLGAGDILWSEDRRNLKFALVLEPETDRAHCAEMVSLFMVAFGDAAGAICPPEVAVTYSWPSQILINGAVVGHVDLALSEDNLNGFPKWLIISLDIAIRPDNVDLDPGKNALQTTMWDEGCGEVTRTQLLESVSRHIVNWIHTWEEDGFKPVHEQWTGRIDGKLKIVDNIGSDAEFIGLDDHGNALVKQDDTMNSIDLFEALQILREARQAG